MVVVMVVFGEKKTEDGNEYDDSGDGGDCRGVVGGGGGTWY